MYRIRGFKIIIYPLIFLKSVIIVHQLAFFKLTIILKRKSFALQPLCFSLTYRQSVPRFFRLKVVISATLSSEISDNSCLIEYCSVSVETR